MRKLLSALIVLLTFVCSYGQNFEGRITSSFGIATDNYTRNYEIRNSEIGGKVASFQLEGNYYLRSNKNLRPYFGLGIGIENRSFKYLIHSNEFNYNIRSIDLGQIFISTPIRLGLEYSLMKNNSIGIYYQVARNFKLENEEIISDSDFAIRSSLEYDYYFNIKTQNHWSDAISVYSKMELGSNLFLITSISYKRNKPYGEYFHSSRQVQTITNLDTNQKTEKHSVHFSKLYILESNYIAIKLGLSKWF